MSILAFDSCMSDIQKETADSAKRKQRNRQGAVSKFDGCFQGGRQEKNDRLVPEREL